MDYKQKYVDSVDGNAHQSAVTIIDQLQARIDELEAEMQKYITLFNLANCYVDITPEHKLFDSIKQDVKACLKRIKGGAE